MPLTYEKPFAVRYYELDATGRVQPVTLLNYLQDAADEHATLLGVGVKALHARDLTWVLSRLHLSVARYAGPGETLLVRTWPSTRGSLFTCREFELLDAAALVVARATTSWVVIDLERRRPVRIAEVLPDYPLDSRRAVDDEFLSLPPCGACDGERRFTVRRDDLDINRHVNNAVYVGWALEATPAATAESLRPIDVEVGYRAEAFAGETVVARCAGGADGSPGPLRYEIARELDGKELARLVIRWS